MNGNQGGSAKGTLTPSPVVTPGRTIFSSMMGTLRSARFEHAIGGISGGVVSTLVLHPLDLIKIRFAGEVMP